MNVFSVVRDPDRAIPLTSDTYHDRTRRGPPYVQTVGGSIKAFALCPACKNPVLLVNRIVPTTKAEILYAKHAGYSVDGIANHDQAEYLDCPFSRPAKLDSKSRRAGVRASNDIKNALLHHFDFVIKQLEEATGISFTDPVIEAMADDFAKNRGHEYKAITLFNLPFGFAYMTEAKDLFGCKVSKAQIAQAISAKSESFTVERYYNKHAIKRKKDKWKTQIRLYFSQHLKKRVAGEESIRMRIVEEGPGVDQYTELYSQDIKIDGSLIYNQYFRRERLRRIAAARFGG